MLRPSITTFRRIPEKSAAVKRVRKVGNVAKMARELDLTESALCNWVQQAEVDEGRRTLGGALSRAERVLEVGCANGQDFVRFLADSPARIYGVDPWAAPSSSAWNARRCVFEAAAAATGIRTDDPHPART